MVSSLWRAVCSLWFVPTENRALMCYLKNSRPQTSVNMTHSACRSDNQTFIKDQHHAVSSLAQRNTTHSSSQLQPELERGPDVNLIPSSRQCCRHSQSDLPLPVACTTSLPTQCILQQFFVLLFSIELMCLFIINNSLTSPANLVKIRCLGSQQNYVQVFKCVSRDFFEAASITGILAMVSRSNQTTRGWEEKSSWSSLLGSMDFTCPSDPVTRNSPA